jgi:hypothetical protein
MQGRQIIIVGHAEIPPNMTSETITIPGLRDGDKVEVVLANPLLPIKNLENGEVEILVDTPKPYRRAFVWTQSRMVEMGDEG